MTGFAKHTLKTHLKQSESKKQEKFPLERKRIPKPTLRNISATNKGILTHFQIYQHVKAKSAPNPLTKLVN